MHSHTHSHSDHYAEANQHYFDEKAQNASADDPRSLELARRVATAMLKVYAFDEDTTTVMDYACGKGIISRELAPYSKAILGVDISQHAVNVYNERVENQGIPAEEMSAVAVSLEGKHRELDGRKFDVIVCTSAYHHFPSINEVTRTLAFFLKPGGCLLVADLLKDDKNDDVFPEHVHHIVAHKGGISSEDIRAAFDGAGLVEFSLTTLQGVKRKGKDVQLFVAKGTKVLGPTSGVSV